MPNEMEKRTNDAGHKEIYHNGEWKLVGTKKEKVTQEYPLKASISIEDTTIKCKARVANCEKTKRNGYALRIDDDQDVYGGASIFVR